MRRSRQHEQPASLVPPLGVGGRIGVPDGPPDWMSWERLSANWRQHPVADVLHHPAAELGGLAGDVQVGDDVDVGDAVVLVRGWRSRWPARRRCPWRRGPCASTTRLAAVGSFSTSSPSPLKVIEIGPSLIFMPPSKVSPSTEVTAAPGRHGAILLDVDEQLPGLVGGDGDGEVVDEFHGSAFAGRLAVVVRGERVVRRDRRSDRRCAADVGAGDVGRARPGRCRCRASAPRAGPVSG